MHPLAVALERAIINNEKNKAVAAGFDAIVAAYYEEYTDATELDHQTYSSLEHLFNICFPSGETDDGRDFESFATKK